MQLKKNNNNIINNNIENNNNIIVGIDLGTNYSCISIFKNGSPNVILDQFGEYFIPSIIAFENNIDPPFLGQMAKFKAEDKKNLLIFDTKRLIGKSFDDINIKKDNFPFELIKDQKSGRIKIKLKLPKKIIDKNDNNISYKEKEFSIELITSIIIKHLKNIAENELKTKIKRAVISVPTSFNDIERELIKKAGEMAGFKIERLINETTAAALAYGFKENNLIKEEKILLFNLGSGTFDISLILLDFTNTKEIEVLATNENLNFCGRNFDYILLEKCLEKINNNKKINFKENSNIIFKLLNECEKAKNILLSKKSATIKIKNLFYNEDFEITFSKEQFENECKNIFNNSCLFTIKKLINDSIKNKKINSIEEIKKIILLGENSKIPFIKNSLENYFKNSNIIFIPKEFISFGACLQGEILKNSEELKIFSLFEVSTYSLGIEMKDGKFSEIIKKNSCIKNKKEKIYQTTSNYQKKILFSVYEGENEYVKNNHFLSDFEYKNFPILPKGEIKIKVLIEIDFNNIFKISVMDENKNEFVFDKNYFFDGKNDLIDLIGNEIFICFDENLKNYRNKIIENNNFNEKYFYQKKIIECYENFINKNFNELINENNIILIDKFHVYFFILIKEYLKILIFHEIDNEIIKNIKKNLFKFMKIILKFEKISVFSILNDFNINFEINNFCSIFRILELFKKGEKLFIKNEFSNCLKYFNLIENEIQNSNFYKQIEFLDKENKNEIEYILNKKNFYLKEINQKNKENFNFNIKNNKSNELNKIIEENLNIVNKENKNNNFNYNNNDFQKYKNIFNFNNNNIENSEFDIENFSLNTFNTFDSKNFDDEKKEEVNYFFNDLTNEELRKFQNENPEKFNKNKNEFEKFGLNFINIIIKKYDNNKKYFNINIEEEYKKNSNKFLNKIKKDFNIKNCPNINENEYSIIIKICNNLI